MTRLWDSALRFLLASLQKTEIECGQFALGCGWLQSSSSSPCKSCCIFRGIFQGTMKSRGLHWQHWWQECASVLNAIRKLASILQQLSSSWCLCCWLDGCCTCGNYIPHKNIIIIGGSSGITLTSRRLYRSPCIQPNTWIISICLQGVCNHQTHQG
jgi:hypothetical protein